MASALAQETANGVITLRGSTDIVTEFFNFSVNNILYQRGVYPPESFKRIAKYGQTLFITTDEKLSAYLQNVLKQLDEWLMEGSVQKLVLIVKGVESSATLERWEFDVAADIPDENSVSRSSASKPLKEINQEISAIMRQITASVTFLPLYEEATNFDLLVYSNGDVPVPVTWEDSDACKIDNAEEVSFRSFSTQIHKVDLAVSYRMDGSTL